MQKSYLFFGAVVIGITAIAAAFGFSKNNSQPAEDNKSNRAQVVMTSNTVEEDFKWYSINEALEVQKISGKKLFIDVYTTWCGPCKMLEANTFSNATIRNLLTEYYIPTKFNAEGADTINFQGQTFVNPKPNAGPRQSTHQFTYYIAKTPNGVAYPTMVFLDEDLGMLQPITGYLTPQQLEPILEYFGNNHYKTIKWEEFSTEFQSSISK